MISFRGMISETASGDTIDPYFLANWSGTIRQASSNTALQSAIQASVNGDLIVVSGAISGSFSSTSISGKILFFRGINNADIYNYSTTGWMQLYSSTALFENMTIHQWYQKGSIQVYSDGRVICNKCHIIGTNEYASLTGYSSSYTAAAELYNCYLTWNNYTLTHFNLNLVEFNKVELQGTFTSSYCKNSLAVADYTTTSTEGYGNAYGTYYIPDSFLIAQGVL